MKPLVSILVPAYNAEEWIADTIQWVLAQTWSNKGIIVVGDGSKGCTVAAATKGKRSFAKYPQFLLQMRPTFSLPAL
jgi:glycosyltransferase involved in cell wall biosynthesis